LKQIDGYLDDMRGASIETRLKLGKAIADLWKLVQPTAGQLRPAHKSTRPAPPQPTQTPQESIAPGDPGPI
jgi:hypothetical protein